MAGPATHRVFWEEIWKYIKRFYPEITKCFPNYNKCSIFIQGHDFPMYHVLATTNIKELNSGIDYSKKLQEEYFPEFVYSYLDNARKNNSLKYEQVRLFIFGYIWHHILDMYTHPLIIYMAGDHVRDPERPTWNHGLVENEIDVAMMDCYENREKAEIYKTHKLFRFDGHKLHPHVIPNLEKALEKTYGLGEIAKKFKAALSPVTLGKITIAGNQLELFHRALKNDRFGLKRLILGAIDPIAKGSASFSYHRKSKNVWEYMNLDNKLWCNPYDNNIESTESFLDLWVNAMVDCITLTPVLEGMMQTGDITLENIKKVIPNKAATHALPCGAVAKMQYTKEIGYPAVKRGRGVFCNS